MSQVGIVDSKKFWSTTPNREKAAKPPVHWDLAHYLRPPTSARDPDAPAYRAAAFATTVQASSMAQQLADCGTAVLFCTPRRLEG